MPKWQPKELLIHKDVRWSDPVAESIRRTSNGIKATTVTSGSPAVIKEKSTILKPKKRERTPLLTTIQAGKQVLYVGPAGKAVDDFSIADPRMVCPHFARLKWASNGCYFQCDWCYLKATFRAAQPYISVHVEYQKMERQLEKRLKNSTGPIMFNAGELADSLSLDHLSKAAEHFIKWFGEQEKGYLFLLTKCDDVDHILHLPHNGHTIVAWSMNAPYVSRKFEKGAPSFKKRLEAARKVKEAGYRVRIRLDPIVPVKGWQKMYADTIRDICRIVKPERITLGTLRFEEQFYNMRRSAVSKALLRHMEDMKPMFPPEKFVKTNGKPTTTSGKYSFSEDERIEIFKFAVAEIRKHSPRIPIALCKESAPVWRALRLNLSRCRCVCQLDYANMAQQPGMSVTGHMKTPKSGGRVQQALR